MAMMATDRMLGWFWKNPLRRVFCCSAKSAWAGSAEFERFSLVDLADRPFIRARHAFDAWLSFPKFAGVNQRVGQSCQLW